MPLRSLEELASELKRDELEQLYTSLSTMSTRAIEELCSKAKRDVRADQCAPVPRSGDRRRVETTWGSFMEAGRKEVNDNTKSRPRNNDFEIIRSTKASTSDKFSEAIEKDQIKHNESSGELELMSAWVDKLLDEIYVTMNNFIHVGSEGQILMPSDIKKNFEYLPTRDVASGLYQVEGVPLALQAVPIYKIKGEKALLILGQDQKVWLISNNAIEASS